MVGATHFIEVYKSLVTGKVYKSITIEVRPIRKLKSELDCTVRSGFLQTIAIWYIKPKIK